MVWLCWTIPDLIQGKIFSIFLNLLGSIPLGIFPGYCYLGPDVYMTDIYDKGKVYQKNDSRLRRKL